MDPRIYLWGFEPQAKKERLASYVEEMLSKDCDCKCCTAGCSDSDPVARKKELLEKVEEAFSKDEEFGLFDGVKKLIRKKIEKRIPGEQKGEREARIKKESVKQIAKAQGTSEKEAARRLKGVAEDSKDIADADRKATYIARRADQKKAVADNKNRAEADKEGYDIAKKLDKKLGTKKRVRTNARWREADHPRQGDGKFKKA